MLRDLLVQPLPLQTAIGVQRGEKDLSNSQSSLWLFDGLNELISVTCLATAWYALSSICVC